MTDGEIVASIGAAVSPVVALWSGWISLRNGNKTNKNFFEIQDFRSVVDRDLEKFKAKLSHGQIVSSTQWNAEFSSYQAIWKGMVAVRTLAAKIVRREDELLELGVPSEYLSLPNRAEARKNLISKFISAAQDLLVAIHDSAPFYPAPIREAANETHGAARDLIDKHLKALAHFSKGLDLTANEQFTSECDTILRRIITGVDNVEHLIRDRLADVQVVDGLVT